MAQIANITVKKNDGTTDMVYTALVPSAGDTVPAQWRADAASTIPAHRPTLKMLTQNNSKRNARVERISFAYPVFQTIGGVEQKIGVIPMELNATIGTNFDTAIINEAVTQFGNLVVSALIRQSMKDGYAPT